MGVASSKPRSVAEVNELLKGEPPIYFYAGHADDTVGSLKDVPIGCTYVNMGVCGLVNRLDVNSKLSYFKNPSDKRFVDINKPQIEDLLDGLSIRTYLPNPPSDKERYVHSTFFPFSTHLNKDKITFSIAMSGLIERRKSVRINYITPWYHNITSISLEELKSFFSMSVYPTPEEIDTYFKTACSDHLNKLTYMDLTRAGDKFTESAETLMVRFPGIHYNFLCRGGLGLPPRPAILRRAISAEAGRTRENAIRQSYREDYPLLDLLETALLFEERKIAVDRAKLITITKSGFIAKGEDSSNKTALLTHLIEGNKASTWGSSLDQKTKNTFLLTAVQNDYKLSIELLIRRGADVNAKDSNGNTPLTFACAIGLESVCHELLARGANVNVTTRNGDTPLMFACNSDMKSVCLELLKSGANVNVTNSTGDTPLIVACSKGLETVCLELLKRSADVNVTNSNGGTPLIWACSNGWESVSLELLKRGAEVNVKTSSGDTPLIFACGRGLASVCHELLKRRAEVNVTNSNGDTPLTFACGRGFESVCYILLEHGAEVNVTNGNGETPLMLAQKAGLESVSIELLKRGATVSAAKGTRAPTNESGGGGGSSSSAVPPPRKRTNRYRRTSTRRRSKNRKTRRRNRKH